MSFINDHILERDFFQMLNIGTKYFVAGDDEVEFCQFGLLGNSTFVCDICVVPVQITDLLPTFGTTTVMVHNHVHESPLFRYRLPVVQS